MAVDSQKYSDEADIASENEERFRSEAIRQASLAKKAPDDWDGETCYDCTGEIVQGRLALGFFTCIECATLREKQKKYWRS